jgi:hypothetical protein
MTHQQQARPISELTAQKDESVGAKVGFRLILALTVLCAALSLVQRAQVEHALSLVSPAFAPPGPQFAIGDFDGDRQPDLAEVHAEPGDSRSPRYSITVHLTSGLNQSFGMTAPFGGLQIVPRDVNGDNAPDLVVSTVLQGHAVAVFLNDGHGNFTRVEPASYPGVFSEPGTNWGSAAHLVTDAVGVPPESRTGVTLQGAALASFRRRAGPVPVSGGGFLLTTLRTSHAGRAPPSAVLRSQS